MNVVCHLTNGIRLRADGREIVLSPGVNTVDDAFWTAWFADHQTFAPVVDGMIVGYADPAPEPPAPVDPETEEQH